MRQADPRVKLLAILLTTALVLTFQAPLWRGGVALVALALCKLFGGDFALLTGRLRHWLPLLLGLCLVQVLFVRQGEILLAWRGIPLVYQAGAVRFWNTLCGFVVLFAAAAVMAGENNRRVIAALAKLKIPDTFGFMVMIALGFIPFFARSFQQAVTSIQLRGLDFRRIPLGKKLKIYSHLLLPVMADAMVKSKELAMSMETRGFGATAKRTSYVNPTLTLQDIVLMIILVSFSGIALYCYLSLP